MISFAIVTFVLWSDTRRGARGLVVAVDLFCVVACVLRRVYPQTFAQLVDILLSIIESMIFTSQNTALQAIQIFFYKLIIYSIW